MRLWHYQLIPYLDRQHLLAQHRECCALRGNGWGRKHATINYVFKYLPDTLFQYHCLVMKEMINRNYNFDWHWKYPEYRGKYHEIYGIYYPSIRMNYPEHDKEYLIECINLLKQKKAPMDFEKIERELL